MQDFRGLRSIFAALGLRSASWGSVLRVQGLWGRGSTVWGVDPDI